MNSLLIDTSAYCALKRGHTGVVQEMQTASTLYVSSVVLGELRAGFAHGGRKVQNESELQQFLDSSRVRTVTIDEDTSVFYAAIYDGLRKAGTLIPTNDLWIASSAMQHGLVVLTLDRHFAQVVQVVVSLHKPESTA